MKKKLFALFGIMVPLAILIALTCAYQAKGQTIAPPGTRVRISHQIQLTSQQPYAVDLIWLDDGRECAVAFIAERVYPNKGGVSMTCTPPTK